MANGQFICELIVNVNGSGITAQMHYRHRSGGSFSYSDQNFPVPTMTIDGQVFQDTGFQNWVRSGIQVGDVYTTNFYKACANGERTVTFTAGRGYRNDFEGSWSRTVTINTGPTTPQNPYAALISTKWNEVVMRISVSSWGQTGAGTPWHEGFIADKNSTLQNLGDTSRSGMGLKTVTRDLSTTFTFPANSYPLVRRGGQIEIKGCLDFKLACYTDNAHTGNASYVSSEVFHTPPAPIDTIEVVKQSRVSLTETAVTVAITGGDKTKNYDANVTTKYSYTVKDGTPTEWTALPTAKKPWEKQQFEVRFPAGKQVEFRARQIYQNQESEVKTTNFVVYKPLSGVKVKDVIVAKDTIKGTVEIADLGSPAEDFTTLEMGVTKKNTGLYGANPRIIVSTKVNVPNKATALTLSNFNSGKVGNPDFTITSNTKYYLGVYAYSPATKFNAQSGDDWSGTAGYQEVITLPETTEVKFTNNELVNNKVTTALTATILSLGGEALELTPQYRYSSDYGSHWSEWANLTPNLQSQSFTIPDLPFGSTIFVESRTKNSKEQFSATSTYRYITSDRPPIIEEFTYSFDELRRNKIKFHLKLSSVYASNSIIKNATVRLDGKEIRLLTDSAAIEANAEDSLSNYHPNAVLSYYVSVSTRDGVFQSLESTIQLPRPIIGVVIYPNGEKKLITDVASSTGPGQFTDRLDRSFTKLIKR